VPSLDVFETKDNIMVQAEAPGRENMKVKDVMTRNIFSTTTDPTLKAISRFLLKHHLNGVPVVDKDGGLLGIITHADIFRAILPSYAEIYKKDAPTDFEEIEGRAKAAARRQVEEVMSNAVITVEEDTPVVRVGSILLLRGIKQLPVVRKERVTGVVTLTDVIQSLIISTPKK